MSGQHKPFKISPKQHAIEQVTKSGFFVDITFEFLQQNCQNEENGEKEVDQLLVLCLGNLHVRSLGQISDWCPNLLVCILPNNHLTSVSAFSECVNLIKLDIHGNRLSSIPGEKFWSKMRHLEFLYLHDNPIASVDTVSHLTVCPKLTALTMYDTPLSLMNKYRHHVVNTLIVLKALDHYVVADQEIIEDLKATERFAAFKQALKINLCPSSNQKISPSVARKQVTVTRRSINHIMAHHSPVMIIQKYIRSFLTRVRLNKLPKTGLMVTTSSEPRSKNDLQLYNLSPACIAAIVPSVSQFLSEQAETSTNSSQIAFAPPQTPQSQEFSEESTAPKCSSYQLQPAPFPSLLDMLQQINGTGDGIHLQKTPSSAEEENKTSSEEEIKSSSEEENKITQKNHNNVSETKNDNKSSSKLHFKTEEAFPLTFTGDEIPFSNFCVQGLKKAVLSADAFSELVLIHHDTAAAIKDSHTKSHMSSDLGNNAKTTRKVSIKKASALNERFQKQILKQVNLSRLFAIQQAYHDQQLANYRRRRMEETQKRNIERRLAQERRQLLREEKRCVTLQEKEQLKQQIRHGMKQNAVKKTEYLEKQRESRNKSRVALSRTEEDIGFMQEFSTKQVSISRALSKHDKQQLQKEVAWQKTKSVKELQDQLQYSREKIKNYQMQTTVARQAKNNVQNGKIRISFAKNSVQKLKESQMRVTHLKEGGRKESVHYSLPLITVNEQTNEMSECEMVKQDKSDIG